MANEKLPEDLVMEILCRLPVKYLLQFKSVCKNWYSLIQNPSFISLHHNRATSIAAARNTDCLLVKRYVDGGNGKIILSLVPNETPTEDIDISSTGLDIGRLQLLGPCNGVVCLTSHGYNSTIVICNPSIREFRVLPKPSYVKDSLTTLGFGFDLYTNDYKVVKFGYMKHPFIPSDNNETIEIYEMSKNSWRIVDAESPISFGFLLCASTSTYWNGGCYWVALCPGGGWAIFVFRMSCDEVFDKIPVPELCLLNKSCRRELLVVNDTLALVLYPLAGDFLLEKCFDIWVMDAQSVDMSWTKKFTIGPLQKPNVPLGFRKNGEFLLQSRGGQMMSYHIDTRQIKEYQICGYRPPRCLQVLLYSESLVSVKRHNQRYRPNDLDGSSVVDFSTL